MYKSLVNRLLVIGFISLRLLCAIAFPGVVDAQSNDSQADYCLAIDTPNGHYTGSAFPYVTVKTVKMLVTAYSSTPDQTDDTPFLTASGKHVADGIIANNKLPFGTKVKIPELYGDKIFTVEDRMHARMGNNHLDIWFPQYSQAKNFGAKYDVSVEILES